MIVVTVFLSLSNQMEFHLVKNRAENSHHDHISFNLKGKRNHFLWMFIEVHPTVNVCFIFYVLFITPVNFTSRVNRGHYLTDTLHSGQKKNLTKKNLTENVWLKKCRLKNFDWKVSTEKIWLKIFDWKISTEKIWLKIFVWKNLTENFDGKNLHPLFERIASLTIMGPN